MIDKDAIHPDMSVDAALTAFPLRERIKSGAMPAQLPVNAAWMAAGPLRGRRAKLHAEAWIA